MRFVFFKNLKSKSLPNVNKLVNLNTIRFVQHDPKNDRLIIESNIESFSTEDFSSDRFEELKKKLTDETKKIIEI